MIFITCLFAAALSPVAHMTEQDIDAYLGSLQARETNLGARIVDVAKRSLGTPYFNGPLGEGPKGKYDKDPLLDLTRVDCVTFVEQTIALALSRTYREAFDTLQKIRYKDGAIDFATRNHFMITDWTVNNTFCKDVTGTLDVPLDKVTRTISKRAYFPKVNAPELGQDIPDKAVTVAYVPVGQTVATATEKLPSPAIVVFVGKVEWLFALHCGLFIRDENGQGLLYHASSKAGEVVATDFVGYLAEQAERYLGFTAYAIDTPESAQ